MEKNERVEIKKFNKVDIVGEYKVITSFASPAISPATHTLYFVNPHETKYYQIQNISVVVGNDNNGQDKEQSLCYDKAEKNHNEFVESLRKRLRDIETSEPGSV